MTGDRRLRAALEQLAQLLADSRGTVVLTDLQHAARRRDDARHLAPTASDDTIGPWRIAPSPDGVALLRRPDQPDLAHADWSPVTDIPGAGAARRVVLLGESAARGWPHGPGFTPAGVLAGQLARAGDYQCVDLSKTGADGHDLCHVAERVAALQPDVIVSFAGNNWALPPPGLTAAGPATTERPDGLDLHHELADALAAGGYPGLRRAFQSAVVLPPARRYLDLLAAARQNCGAEIIIVVPEFNLRGWTPPADIETTALPASALRQWYALRAEAQHALTDNRPQEVPALARRMAQLDGGCSPIPGHLLGLAATRLGDGALARQGFEQSRDAVCGLLVRYTPRAVRAVQDLLVSYADAHGWPCVDLRKVLAAADLPDLPDESNFHDYCHLSDTGIERAMAAVTDAICRRPPGSTRPGAGLPDPEPRGFVLARAAAHLAYQGQPADAVRARLAAALRLAPSVRPLLADTRDVLAAPKPAWTHPAVTRLAGDAQVWPFIAALAAQPALSPELWTLRSCLDDLLADDEPERAPASDAGRHPARQEIDLVAAPHPDGHPLPNWAAPRAHHHATARRSVFGFAVDAPVDGILSIAYRMPTGSGSTAEVYCGPTRLGDLPPSPVWASTRLAVPTDALRPGVNWITVIWPPECRDPTGQVERDAEALGCGRPAYVLPLFGEVHEARLLLSAGRGQ
ncbi:hypothetical protein [Micromonospora craterilacus]|nr:hypothetical protein [Micromonospora craterilacus]